MSEKEKRKCSRVKLKRLRMNIIDYLYKRSIDGYRDDSKRFANKLFDTAKDLYKKDLTAHFGCVNAIEFSGDGNLLFSGGDDRRVLVWNVNDAMLYYTGKLGEGTKPNVMKGCHYSNIFCLAVDDENKRVLSGSNDDQVIVHDYATGNSVDVFLHDSPVFSLSLHPNNGNIFASAADNGRILIYDIRESNADLLCVAKLRTPFHGVMFNPCEPSLIATANSKVGVHIWDLRKPKEILIKCNDEPSMAVRWNQNGTILLALRNLLPIVIYDPLVPKRKLEFDSGTYFNACTMKSCSFAGANDEYILSGSDDFNLYMWKIPDPWPESNWIGSEHLALTGHRSIVNQVRYSSSKQLIATSGVEKIIKLWSPFRLPYSEGDRDKPSAKRHRILCSSRSCTRSPGFLSHDYSQESVEEDTRMIHFFDSLLQNELDDMPLSESFYLDSNLFAVPNRKKETRLYEKLIKKKKKYLSKILIEKSDESKSVCSLDESMAADGDKRAAVSRDAASGAPSPDGPVRGPVRAPDGAPDGAPVASSDFSPGLLSSSKSSSSSSSSTPVSSADSSSSSGNSQMGSDRSFADSAASSGRLPSNFSEDSDDSNEPRNRRLNGDHLNRRRSKENSDGSDSDRFEPCTIFKRKRSIASRCYRNSTKRKRKERDSSDSELSSESGKIALGASSSGREDKFAIRSNSDDENPPKEKH